MKANKGMFYSIFFLIFLSACNMPKNNEEDSLSASDLVLTSAVETVEAQLTLNPNPDVENAPQPTSNFPTPQTTTSNNATPTTNPSSVPELTLCDEALFIDDITVSDGEDFSPGELFMKTWRLQNVGTCTWTSGYEVVFSDGDSMSGPPSKQLTTVSIAPGEMIDISVELTAPAEVNTYTGYWKLRNANGELFTLTNDQAFWVEIDVVAPTPTPGPNIETITITVLEDGEVQSDGNVYSPPYVGDTSENLGLQAFFQFDISSIPLSAIINEVVVSFNNFDELGLPFTELGCLRGYHGDYFPLDASDYVTSSGASMKWCNSAELGVAVADEDVKSEVQNALGNTYIEYRLQFNETETNNDSIDDLVRFGTVALKITYQVDP
ncbi:MAG: hypothetical protein HON98_06005 [Chloroflexi bacterium]|jgi:hypothetical protein|nr:hypothetical protein [Chloroflexota bacterium]MBT3670581.1 hypothetical protein [Chloroflexota bacterium]MBT4002871.1 hypothetical protein [Chloroflexota bacterium]MBT4304216.1 hypothetical protein [Chloroflexota bacterium]MBT4533425.1 hypothetical protein [Chloroflexota bacterium]